MRKGRHLVIQDAWETSVLKGCMHRVRAAQRKRMTGVIKKNLQSGSQGIKECEKLGVINIFRCRCMVGMPYMIHEKCPLD